MFKSLRKWLHDNHGIWFHAQNLMECQKCGTAHGIAWYGRNWLHLSDRKGFSTCWLWFMKRISDFSFSFEVGSGDNEDGLTLHLSVPYLFSLWWSAEGFIKSRVRKVGKHYVDYSHRTEIRYDLQFGAWGSLWWKLATNDNEWTSQTPRWREGSFDPADLFLGKQVYSNEKIGEAEAHALRLPDGIHPLTIQMERATWKRPRWPYANVINRAEVVSEKGVPIPGKGENSWDCGEDATFSLTCPAETADEALSKFMQSIMETRKRYGGDNWRPEAKKSVEA